MGNITNLYDGIAGTKHDFKVDWREDAKADWKVDWASVPVTLPPGAVAVSNTVAPAITGTPAPGSTLTVSNGTWLGTPSPSFAIQWYNTYTGLLVGETSSTYVVQNSDAFAGIYAVVTGSNSMPISGPIATLGSVTGGSAYTDGTYNGVALTGGSGTGATANIVVASGAVTTVTPVALGDGYEVGDVLSAAVADIGGTGSGFHVPVATITADTFQTSSASAKSNTVAVSTTAIAPANVTLPSISGNALIASQLTANVGTWTGFPTPLFTYSWKSTHAPIATLGSVTSGSSYVNGTYTNVSLTGGTGTGAIATVTVAGGAVTTVLLTNDGNGYVVGDTLSADNSQLGGAGSGFSVPVATLSAVGTDKVYITQGVDAGANITVTVTATNSAGAASATSASFGPILASQTAPSNSVLPAITGTATVGSTLTVTPGTWSGTPTPVKTYQWLSGGIPITAGELISHSESVIVSDAFSHEVGQQKEIDSPDSLAFATGTTYVVRAEDVGNAIQVVETAASVAGSATATSAATSVVPAVAPANTVLPVISGSPLVGGVLEAGTGTWTGAPAPTFTWQWYSGATPVAAEDITTGDNNAGEVQVKSSYVVKASDVGNSITVKVIATNTAGSANVTSAGVTANAALVAPALTAAGHITNPSPAVAGQVTVGDVLDGTAATFSGTPSPTLTYQWLANNGVIPGATALTYTVASQYNGMTISFQTIATNTAGSVSNTSAAVGPVLI